jgi:hypothetical protein
MLYSNLAYLSPKLKRKEKVMKYVKKSILASSEVPAIPSAAFLLIRILRSNCQSEEALALATSS